MKRAFIISLVVGLLALLLGKAEGTAAGAALGALTAKAGTAVAVGLALYLLYLAILKVSGKEVNKQHDKRAAKRTREWVIGCAGAFVVIAYGLHYVPI